MSFSMRRIFRPSGCYKRQMRSSSEAIQRRLKSPSQALTPFSCSGSSGLLATAGVGAGAGAGGGAGTGARARAAAGPRRARLWAHSKHCVSIWEFVFAKKLLETYVEMRYQQQYWAFHQHSGPQHSRWWQQQTCHVGQQGGNADCSYAKMVSTR